MTKAQIEVTLALTFSDLNAAKLAISEGNFWLAKSYLKTAIASANKAGCKRLACIAMRALQNVAIA